MLFQATVSNNSKANIDKLKFAIYQIVEYHSKTPKTTTKTETKRLLKKEIDVVKKLPEQKIEHIFNVPVTTPTQGPNISQMIQISYELKVEAKLGTFIKNLTVTIPITIGTHDEVVLRSHSSSAQYPDVSRQSIFSNASMDFQNSINRSSIVPSSYPTSPVPFMPGQRVASPNGFNSISPIQNPPYPLDARMSMVSNTSFGSIGSYSPMYPNLNSSYPSSTGYNPMYSIQSNTEVPRDTYRASAPPMDFTTNTSTTIRPMTFPSDRPPSYDEVFTGQLNQLHITNSPPLTEVPRKC